MGMADGEKGRPPDPRRIVRDFGRPLERLFRCFFLLGLHLGTLGLGFPIREEGVEPSPAHTPQ